MGKQVIKIPGLPSPSPEARALVEQLKAKHKPEQGKAERIARQVVAWNARPRYDLDAETVRWLAEDKDLEHLDQ